MNERARNYSSGRGVSDPGRSVRDKFIKDSSTNPPTLRKVGETDQYGLIQSFADECDVNRILARFEAGDASVLQRVQGLYYDATGIPSEPTELMNLGSFARDFWDKLPYHERAKFNFDKENFLNALFFPPADQSAGGDPAQNPQGDDGKGGDGE